MCNTLPPCILKAHLVIPHCILAFKLLQSVRLCTFPQLVQPQLFLLAYPGIKAFLESLWISILPHMGSVKCVTAARTNMVESNIPFSRAFQCHESDSSGRGAFPSCAALLKLLLVLSEGYVGPCCALTCLIKY